MLARTVQAPAWSKQAYVCRACRRQWHISHQRRWNSQQSQNSPAAVPSDSWFDTINEISDEYSSHTPAPSKPPKDDDKKEISRKSRRSRLADGRQPKYGAMSIKSLQDTLDATIPARPSGESIDSLATQDAKHADFEAAFLSGQSRHRDRRKQDVAANLTAGPVQGVARTNDAILANLLDGLKADAKTMAVQQDEGFDQPREEDSEQETVRREDAGPVPFPSFRGRPWVADYVDVSAGQSGEAKASEGAVQPTVWKAKTSPSESGLGGPVVARVGSDRPMSLLDRHRQTQSKSAWGAAEERASSPPPKVTFNTLSKADRSSPKKENDGPLTKRPFGFVDRVKMLWRGPAKQADAEEHQAAAEEHQNHASPELERKSSRPNQADDMGTLLSRLVKQSEPKNSAEADGSVQENLPSSDHATGESKQQNIEQLKSREEHTSSPLVDPSAGLPSQADILATDSLAKLHADLLQRSEEGSNQTANSRSEQSLPSQQVESVGEEPLSKGSHKSRGQPSVRKLASSRRDPVSRRMRRLDIVRASTNTEAADAQCGSLPSVEYSANSSQSEAASGSEVHGANQAPNAHEQSPPDAADITEQVPINGLSGEHGKSSAGEAVNADGQVPAEIPEPESAGVSLAEAMKDVQRSRSKPPRRQARGKAKASSEKTQAKPDAVQVALRNDVDGEEELEEQAHVDVLSAQLSDLQIQPVDVPQPPVPYLEYGLSRALFNPGVYQLQDAASRVYNFDPYLQKIMPVEQFDFNALKEYKTSSQDTALAAIAKEQGRRYIGSTSSMTSSLAHFHYLISNWRPLNLGMLSHGYVGKHTRSDYTKISKAPSAIFLRWKNGSYAIDADKEFDSANVLMLLGKSMELLLTLPKDEYEKYRKSDPRTVSREQRTAPESYQYTTMGDFLMRSQLDAYDPRLPGNGTFDLKTRAVVTIRMSAHDHEKMTGYEIYGNQGRWGSYEKEYHDMARATMLKYMLQARMGRMNGIFVAYHNVKRIFGFQYVPIADMDLVLHGQSDTCLGDQEFKASLKMMNDLLNKATSKYPEQSLRIHFETQSSPDPDVPTCLHMFAEPMTEQDIDQIQNKQKEKIAEYERNIMGKEDVPDAETSTKASGSSEASSAKSSESQDQASDYARQQMNFKSTDAPADQPFLNQVQDTPPEDAKPLFYATAIVQSDVNGSVQNERPEYLTKEDEWTLNYLIKDYEVTRHHWALYDDMKARRRQALYFEREEADEADGEADGKSKAEAGFIMFLENMSKKGEAIREKQDLADQESGSNVVRVDDPLPRVREKVETLEDYIRWMYQKEQE
ncbi:hypothetical protein Slin15195_G044880 [Septoria linicola]|uniref:Pet127-domain-containing protein n=1 Tax=Septoria linicola TaxID=215465 RepID=A0A9Q9AKV0_9PEZI|nr:hypothetical protein Slin14017_G048400 [Septoria linicola]USW51169.1 hypothetical protein Slin15195_G044880 [Septoria linicola]